MQQQTDNEWTFRWTFKEGNPVEAGRTLFGLSTWPISRGFSICKVVKAVYEDNAGPSLQVEVAHAEVKIQKGISQPAIRREFLVCGGKAWVGACTGEFDEHPERCTQSSWKDKDTVVIPFDIATPCGASDNEQEADDSGITGAGMILTGSVEQFIRTAKRAYSFLISAYTDADMQELQIQSDWISCRVKDGVMQEPITHLGNCGFQTCEFIENTASLMEAMTDVMHVKADKGYN